MFQLEKFKYPFYAITTRVYEMGEWILTRVVIWDALEQTKFFDGIPEEEIKCPYCKSERVYPVYEKCRSGELEPIRVTVVYEYECSGCGAVFEVCKTYTYVKDDC